MEVFSGLILLSFGGFVTGAIVNAIASQKGLRTETPWWFIFGFFFFIVALPVVLLTPENKERKEEKELGSGHKILCPACAELIRPEATICRYCHTSLKRDERPAA